MLDRDVLDRGAGPIGDATVSATFIEGDLVYGTAAIEALG